MRKDMMEFMTAQEAAEKWGITVRRVQILCSEGKIQGAVKYASVWAIPRSAEKPVDGRGTRKKKYNRD